MDSAFLIAGEPDILMATLCPIDEGGHIRFGCFGHSRKPYDHKQLLAGHVEILDYFMECFVLDKLSAERTNDGLCLLVRKSGSNPDEFIDWFVERYITSKGLAVSKRLA